MFNETDNTENNDSFKDKVVITSDVDVGPDLTESDKTLQTPSSVLDLSLHTPLRGVQIEILQLNSNLFQMI